MVSFLSRMLIFKKWETTIIFWPPEKVSTGFKNNFSVSFWECRLPKNKTIELFLKLAEIYDALCLIVRILLFCIVLYFVCLLFYNGLIHIFRNIGYHYCLNIFFIYLTSFLFHLFADLKFQLLFSKLLKAIVW